MTVRMTVYESPKFSETETDAITDIIEQDLTPKGKMPKFMQDQIIMALNLGRKVIIAPAPE